MFWYLVVHADRCDAAVTPDGCFHLLRRRQSLTARRKVRLVLVEAQAIEPSPEIEGRRAGSE